MDPRPAGWMTLFAVAALSLACASNTLPPTAARACGDYASAICKLYQSCSNGWYITEEFGDLATCTAQFTANCESRLSVPSGETPEREDACARAIPSYGCAALYGNSLPDPCSSPAGSLATAAPCATDAQCQSTYCALDKNRLCGVCAAPPAAGADCSLSACPDGLVCLRPSLTCGVQLGDGGACVGEGDCQFGLACLAHPGASGFCMPTGTSGSPCDPEHASGLVCPSRLGLYCKRSAPDAGTCEPYGQGDAGQACADVGGIWTVCASSGLCQKTPPDAGEGLCLAAAGEGQACDIDAGPNCLDLERCALTSDGGTAGICQYPASMSCE